MSESEPADPIEEALLRSQAASDEASAKSSDLEKMYHAGKLDEYIDEQLADARKAAGLDDESDESDDGSGG